MTVPAAPFELALLRYRKEMGLSWQELLETPWEVLAMDMEIFEIEASVIKLKQESKT